MKSSQSIHRLSDKELLDRVEKLGTRERETTAEILRYLIEIEKRELCLAQGYNSLYDFCIRHLGYSESAALRRIRTARCIRAYPQVRVMLQRGEVSLDTISKISKVLTGTRGATLLEKIRGKSSREVALVLSRHSPNEKPRDRVQPIYVRMVSVPSAAVEEEAAGGKKFTAGAGGKRVATSSRGSGDKRQKTWLDVLEEEKASRRNQDEDLPHVDIKRKYKLEFAVEPGFMEKIERLRALLSKRQQKKLDFETIFELVIDEYLDRHSPEGRMKRRAKRKSKAAGRSGKGNGSCKKPRTGKKGAGDSKQSRYIPQSIKDEVYARDGGRCAYVGTNGRRCIKRENLEVDHIVPFARGGANTPDNLRLLCARHNMLEAERAYGKDHMQSFRRRG